MATSPFVMYDGSSDAALAAALLASNGGGIVVDTSSIVLHASGSDAVNFYDGSITGLGIGAGLLLTSGTTPSTTNTSTGFGTDNSGTSGFSNGDADIDAVVNHVFQTQSYDATTLSFAFSVTDPNATSISFDLVFGSDEYPEWVDAFVDSAVVMVNGTNYALFNHDPNAPLSVISSNLAAGYFQDNNGTNLLAIEYDGVSHMLKIVAPIIAGQTNTIKIGIADTGDHVLDSGIFLANLSAGTTPGSGVVDNPGGGTTGDDTCTGSSKSEYFDLQAGNDIAYAGGGDDIVVAGAGKDQVYGGSGNDELKGDSGDDWLDGGADVDTAVYTGASSAYNLSYDVLTGVTTVNDSQGLEGLDSLVGIELLKFSDGVFNLNGATLTPAGSPPPPTSNAPGLVLLSGIAAAGHTLTANLSDPDGTPNPISWEWQTSGDGGTTWSTVIGATNNTYDVLSGDANQALRAIANYIDGADLSSNAISAGKAILASTSGDLKVTLLQLEAPIGFSEVNPITTLVQRAIDLGLSPNQAVQAISSVLNLPAGIKLNSYDAYQVLQTSPSDAKALTMELVAVQVAIFTSLSDDDTGINLSLALVNAAAAGQTIDLANAATLAQILGVDITGLSKQDYPQPLKEIVDRNKSMAEAIADGQGLAAIAKEWTDLLSIQDGIASTSIADLSHHLNQAPIGTANAVLAAVEQGGCTLLSSSDLLAGFSDADGDTLLVSGLGCDGGGSVTDNGDGSWTFVADGAFSGPVELSYTVEDGNGGLINASQLLVVTAPPAADQEASGSLVVDGLALEAGLLIASLNDLVDADGATSTDYRWQEQTGASWSDLSGQTSATLAIPDDQSYVGKTVRVLATSTDILGGSTEFSSAGQLIANVDDAASGSLEVSGTAAEGGALSALLNNVVDADGTTSTDYRWQEWNGASWSDLSGKNTAILTIPDDQSYVGKTVRVLATSTDILGGSTEFSSAGQLIANVNDQPTGGVSLTGTLKQGQILNASNSIADDDGLGAITYTWQGANTANGTYSTLATGGSYQLAAGDVNHYIRVVASYTDGCGTTESLASAATASPIAVVDSTPPMVTGMIVSGNSVTLSFSEAIKGTNLLAANFKRAIGTATAVSAKTISLDTVTNTVTLSFSGSSPTSTSAVKLSYSAISGNANAGLITDQAGNPLLTFGNRVAETYQSAANVTTLGDNGLTLPATSYTNLVLTGSAITGNGNALANTIIGTTAANSLDGKAGNDFIDGGDGGDLYIVSSSADHAVAEFKDSGSSGNDQARFTSTTANQILHLYAGDTGLEEAVIGTGTTGTATTTGTTSLSLDATEVLNALSITGNNGANSLLGSAFGDSLFGNGGADIIHGNGGNDSITGGTGRDVLTGEGGIDSFVYSILTDSSLQVSKSNTAANYDRITDLDLDLGDGIVDRIDGPTAISAGGVTMLATAVTNLTAAGISAVLTTSTFGAFKAVAFSYGSQTFLALNDKTAGFSATNDGLIDITGFSGNLNNLAIL